MASPACANLIDVGAVTHFSCIPAVAIILALACLERRRFRPDVCGGKPALIIPIPLLDGYDNRCSYAAAFGAIMTTIVSLLLHNGNTYALNIPIWAQALVIQVQALEACLTCFPFFACITTRQRMVGAILGFLYSIVFFSVRIADCVQAFCKVTSDQWVFRVTTVLNYLPMLACFLYLLFKFLHSICICLLQKSFVKQEEQQLVYPHQKDYVRLAMTKDYKPMFESTMKEKLLYKCVSGFKYPVRVVCVAFVLVLGFYQIGVWLLGTGIYFHILLSQYNNTVWNVNYTFGNNVIYILTPTAYVLVKVLYFSISSFTVLTCFFYVYLFMKSYRRHILRMFRGDKKFIFDKLPTPDVMMASSLRFPSYQIAYMLWGLIVLFLHLTFTFALITYGVYFLAINDWLWRAFLTFLQLLSFPAFALLLFYTQVILSRRVLMQTKINQRDEHPPLNIDNRRFYECFNYYSLFGSLAIGIFACLSRINRGGIFGVFMVGRLDHSIYPRGWEHTDRGYISYISMLHVENAHNHPILRVFCDVLLSGLRKSREGEDVRLLVPGEEYRRSGSKSQNTRPVKRWHLAYTLINNPVLTNRRKSAILAERNRRFGITVMERQLTGVDIEWPIDDTTSLSSEPLLNNSLHRL